MLRMMMMMPGRENGGHTSHAFTIHITSEFANHLLVLLSAFFCLLSSLTTSRDVSVFDLVLTVAEMWRQR